MAYLSGMYRICIGPADATLDRRHLHQYRRVGSSAGQTAVYPVRIMTGIRRSVMRRA
jgi:hypothetical protein